MLTLKNCYWLESPNPPIQTACFGIKFLLIRWVFPRVPLSLVRSSPWGQSTFTAATAHPTLLDSACTHAWPCPDSFLLLLFPPNYPPPVQWPTSSPAPAPAHLHLHLTLHLSSSHLSPHASNCTRPHSTFVPSTSSSSSSSCGFTTSYALYPYSTSPK